MSALYSVSFSAVAVTAAQDAFELSPGTNKSCIIHAIFLSQHSDFGDAQDELLHWMIKRGATVSGSGGSSFTPVPLRSGGAASAAAAETNNTTRANTGTISTLHDDAFNVRAGLIWIPTPECRITVDGGSRIIVGIEAAPTDSLTMNGTLLFEEI